MKITAVIVGGGSSTRMKGTDKLALVIGGMSVFERSIKAFSDNERITGIVVVAREDLVPWITGLRDKYPKIFAVVPGGSSRCLSVKNGINSAPEDTEYFAIHDAARPFVSSELISRTADAAEKYGGAAPAVRVTDTIKKADPEGYIADTLDRNALRAVSTPQIFRADLYRQAISGEEEAFDDCQVFEKAGNRVMLVEGEVSNFKITNSEDIKRARMQVNDSDIRIGHGYDVHRLVEGRKLILGGVEIPFEKGLLGHSDADVLLHAVCDAILGAAALRDIGVHFPDNDPAYEGIDSRIPLRKCVALAAEKGLHVASLDCTILCQRPKLAGYMEQIKKNIVEDTGACEDCVNVKATTEEKLGFTGEGLGISAHAVVLLSR